MNKLYKPKFLNFFISIIFILFFTSAIAATSDTFCNKDQVLCTSGLYASCSNTSYLPSCVYGFPSCCRDATTHLDCMADFLVCTATLVPSSSSSSSSSSGAYCFNDQVVCPSGIPSCTNSAFDIQCVNGFPSCCRDAMTHLECRYDFLNCSSNDISLGIDQFKTINVDVTTTPKLPDIIQLPLVTDEYKGRVGYAYIGSSPSFEIKLPTAEPNLKVISVDLLDKKGTIFRNVPFNITTTSESLNTQILSLNLPEIISKGELRFVLNFNNSSSLAGIIQVIDFLEVQASDGRDLKSFSEPFIKRVSVSRNGQTVTLNLRGGNFTGRKIFYKLGNITNFQESVKNNPSTFVTIFPSFLNIELKQRQVSADGKNMKIKFKFSQNLKRKVKSVLVVVTPRGITSVPFTLK